MPVSEAITQLSNCNATAIGNTRDNDLLQGLINNREKQEIKTVRIVKRESERRQRDRGDRTGNIGIPLMNGLQAPGGAKRLCDDDLGGSQKFEVISFNSPDYHFPPFVRFVSRKTSLEKCRVAKNFRLICLT